MVHDSRREAPGNLWWRFPGAKRQDFVLHRREAPGFSGEVFPHVAKGVCFSLVFDVSQFVQVGLGPDLS